MQTAQHAGLRRIVTDLKARTPQFEMESVACLLCGGRDFEPVIAAADVKTGVGGDFRVVRCRKCDLVFTNPRPTEATIGVFYPDDYQPWQGRGRDEPHRGPIGRALERAVLSTCLDYPRDRGGRLSTQILSVLGRWRFQRSEQRLFWIPFRKPGRLLDFGCGGGNFLLEMRQYGWTVEGMDVSSAVAREVKSRTGIHVHVGTLPHPDLAPDSFDAVTMWNALEHVHHPRQTVRAAHRALRKGGLLVIGVPSIDSWTYRRFGRNWHCLELPRHLVHFTPKTLGDLAIREGFEIRSLNQVGRSGFLRKSARLAAAHGANDTINRLCLWKPTALRIARWTERTGQSDFIRLVAEKL